ncbi:MAG: 2-amino-4-hydroxy-6-hydroxymethyldihydropteridine diphosphokinase [Planktomarina sp.]
MNKKALFYDVLIAIGSNQPGEYAQPINLVQAAIDAISKRFDITAISAFYQTEAFPAGSGPDYINAAVVIKTACDPQELLDQLHKIEEKFQRTRTHRWASRTLDLDLIAYGDVVRPDRQTVQKWMELPLDSQKTQTPDQLILPHPRLQDRGFVLGPIKDICPNWTHPMTQKTILQMWNDLPDADRTLRKINVES